MRPKDFVPPIVVKAVRRLQKPRLFDGDDAMFRSRLQGVSVYGEYGMGASSRWVLANTSAKVIAVDTSEAWVDAVRTAFEDEPRLTATWIDVGPLGDWGTPLGFTRSDNFERYFNEIWTGEDQPEVVLVDGRFRVACFLTSLLRAAPGARIIFDDYGDRPHYHVVEDFLKPVETCGRQALFIVPEALDRDLIEKRREAFRYVRD